MERLVVCSHRGPVAYVRNGGRLEPRRAGPGGLVAVLGPALRQREATWIFAPSTAADREIAADRRTDLTDGNVAMRISRRGRTPTTTGWSPRRS
jgi:trehalose-6-phosphate synthase